MTAYLPAFAVLASLAAILLWMLSRVRPKTALVLAVLLTAAGYVAATEPLGHAKPARIEFLRSLDQTEVLYFDGDESSGIRILTADMLYSLPWSEQTMRELHEASQRAASEGGAVELRERGDGAEGGEYSVEWSPPPLPRPKG